MNTSDEILADASDELICENRNIQIEAIRRFISVVERIAENNMFKTGKLEGAHYAAMKQVFKDLDA